MDTLMIALVVAALVIGGLLMVFIQLTSGRVQKLDTNMYRKVWEMIERSMQTSQVDSMQMAIMKADKLLDKAMRESNIKGATMGERLKARKGMWTNENAVWAAHKLRNQIAHDDHVLLNEKTARRAMAGFERALKDLGVL